MKCPFECDEIDGEFVPVEGRAELVQEAIELIKTDAMSIRAASIWLSDKAGKRISHVTLKKKYDKAMGFSDLPGDRRKRAAERAAKKKQETIQRRLEKKRKERALKKAAKKPTKKAGRVVEDSTLAAAPKATREELEEKIIFRPNEGPQEDFLASPETDVLYGGAAGGGKSYAMIIDPLRYAHKAAHRALILRKTMPELRELIDKSRELYPKAFPGAKFREVEKRWKFPSGATVEFGFLEKDADVYRYQGQAFSWIGFDEITHLATEFPWQYLGSRLRTTDPEIDVYLRCTANPGGVGHGWVKKRYIDPAPSNTAFKYGTNPVTKEPLTRKFIPATLSDNPHLANDGRYEAMLESLDELSRRRLLNGDWNINEGTAFPEFHRESHVIEPFDIPAHWNRFKGADYGYASPSAVVWLAVDPEDGTLIVYKELYAKGLTANDLGQMIVDLEADEVMPVPGVLDTAAWNRTGYTGPTIGQTLCGPPYNIKFRPADKNRVGGKIQIHQRLKVNSDTGRPGLQFFSTCKDTIREIETLTPDPNNSEDVDTKQSDHAYDALRYAIMSRPKKESTYDLLGKIKMEAQFNAFDETFGY